MEILNQPLLTENGSQYVVKNTLMTQIMHARPRTLRHCMSTPHIGRNTYDIKPVPEPKLRTSYNVSTFQRTLIFLSVYLLLGVFCSTVYRTNLDAHSTTGVVDALYFTVVTMTTVGYGDIVPATIPAKLLTCAFVLSGFALAGLLLGEAANYLVEKQERILEHAIFQKHHPAIIENEGKKFAEHKLAVCAFLVLFMFGIGTLVLIKVEHLNLVDALYCVCVTMTTLGYGDESFSTTGGRAFAAVWILVSTLLLAQLICYIAEYIAHARQQALVDWVLSRKITVLDIEAADADNDQVVSASEFIIFKLREMEKITDEDVGNILSQFHRIDKNASGTITLSDLKSSSSEMLY